MKVGLFICPVRFSSIAPIDLAYLSSYLKSRGHEVYSRDFNIELPVNNDCDTSFWIQQHNQQDLFKRNISKIEKWVEDIIDFSPDFIGMSVWETQLYFSSEIARMIKERNRGVKVIFGGPWCSANDRGLSVMESVPVDFIVFGEGELTLSEIVESADSDRPVPGCLKKRAEKVIDGGWREESVNPDSLPFPDYDGFDLDRYLHFSTYPILFNRGCNWNCSFCGCRSVWRKFRSRSAENIFSEIQQCFSNNSHAKQLYSCDHSINSNMVELEKLCDLIIEHGIKIEEISGFGQVNPRMKDGKVLNKLKEAGFTKWGIGIQSGSDRILKNMRRPYTAYEAEEVLKEMHDHGLSSFIDFIIGYPEETEDDFKQTLEFISRVSKYVENVSVAPTCHVGANDLWYYPKRYGIVTPIENGDAWESFNSTPSVRARRYRTIMEHLSALGVSHKYSDSDRQSKENLSNKV